MKKPVTYTDPETGEVFEGYRLRDFCRDLCDHPIASLYLVGDMLLSAVILVQYL